LNGVEGDGVAELVEGPNGSVAGAVGVASHVVVAAEVLVLGGRGELAIEVKGFPGRSYADPRKADQVKPTNPLTQARHWYAAAMLQAMLMRAQHPAYESESVCPCWPRRRCPARGWRCRPPC
jgi:hypothetical protein